MFIAGFATFVLGGMYIGAGILALFFFIFNYMFYCYYTHFKTSLAVIGVATDFLLSTKRIIFVSMGHFLVEIIVFAIWLYAAGNLYNKVNGPTQIVLLCAKVFLLYWIL